MDEDAASGELVRALRLREIDVVTVHTEGMDRRSDEVQLDAASRDGRVIYSHNLGDFSKLHRDWLAGGRSHAGIVLAAQRLTLGEQLRRLSRLVEALDAEGM